MSSDKHHFYYTFSRDGAVDTLFLCLYPRSISSYMFPCLTVGTLIIMEQLRILLIVAFAMLLGGVIGFDREVEDKPAGLRTYMFVAGASALLVSVADILVMRNAVEPITRSDPLRLLEAIITGISFLGAGTILRYEEKVEGLTTAASLLFTAGIGLSVALEQYIISIGATLLALLVLRLLKRFEKKIPESE